MKEKRKQTTYIQPKEVESGPILENCDRGDKVNIFKFPTPKWRTPGRGKIYRYRHAGDQPGSRRRMGEHGNLQADDPRRKDRRFLRRAAPSWDDHRQEILGQGETLPRGCLLRSGTRALSGINWERPLGEVRARCRRGIKGRTHRGDQRRADWTSHSCPCGDRHRGRGPSSRGGFQD